MTVRRRPLPGRRRSQTFDLDRHVHATIGVDGDGVPSELFMSTTKSAESALLDDAAVIVSIALQSGISAAVLAKSVGRVPATEGGPPVLPASIIGAAIDLIAGCKSPGPGSPRSPRSPGWGWGLAPVAPKWRR